MFRFAINGTYLFYVASIYSSSRCRARDKSRNYLIDIKFRKLSQHFQAALSGSAPKWKNQQESWKLFVRIMQKKVRARTQLWKRNRIRHAGITID